MGKIQVCALTDEEDILWLRAHVEKHGLRIGRFVGKLISAERRRHQEAPTAPEEASEVPTPPEPPKPQETAPEGEQEVCRSDPEAVAALLAGCDEFLASAGGVQEAVRRLRNPGDYLDEEAESAVSACGELAETELKAISDAREHRYEIVASWGNQLAEMLISIDQDEQDLDTCGPRKRRALQRRLSANKEQLTLFRKKIRADLRVGKNIPENAEDARKLLARRSGDRKRSLIVIEGARKVS